MNHDTTAQVLLSLARHAVENADTSQLKQSMASLKNAIMAEAMYSAKPMPRKFQTAADEKSAELEAFNEQFVEHISKAYSYAIVYGTLLSLSGRVDTYSAEERLRILDLGEAVAGDIASSLRASHQLILNSAGLLGLSKRDTINVDYLYNSGACLEPDKHEGVRSSGHSTAKGYRDTDSIVTLVRTLAIALTTHKN